MASTSIEVKYEDGTDDRYFILTHPILFINPIILDDMKRKSDVDCFMAMRKSLIFRGYILLQYLCNDLLSPMKYFNLESFDVGILEVARFYVLRNHWRLNIHIFSITSVKQPNNWNFDCDFSTLRTFRFIVVRCCKISYYISWQNALKKAVFLDMWLLIYDCSGFP